MPPPSPLPISGETRTLWTAARSAVEDIVDAGAVVALSGLVGSAAVDLGGDAAVVPAATAVDNVAGGDEPTVNVGVDTIGALNCTVFANVATVVSAMSATTRDGAGSAAMMVSVLVGATAAARSTTLVNGGWTAVGADDTTASTFDVASFTDCITGAVALWANAAVVAFAVCVTGATVEGAGTGLEVPAAAGAVVCDTACCTGAAVVCTGAAVVCTGAAVVCTGAAVVCAGAGAVGVGVAFTAGALGAGALGAGALGSAALGVTAAGCVAAVTIGTAEVPGSAARASPANAAKQTTTPVRRIHRASLFERVDMPFLFPPCGHMSRKTWSEFSEKAGICGRAIPAAQPYDVSDRAGKRPQPVGPRSR
jgi:hypothetical protein